MTNSLEFQPESTSALMRLNQVTSYEASYGAVGAGLLFSPEYICRPCLLVIGAKLNCEVDHLTEMGSATGPPRPWEKRGAWATDGTIVEAAADGQMDA